MLSASLFYFFWGGGALLLKKKKELIPCYWYLSSISLLNMPFLSSPLRDTLGFSTRPILEGWGGDLIETDEIVAGGVAAAGAAGRRALWD